MIRTIVLLMRALVNMSLNFAFFFVLFCTSHPDVEEMLPRFVDLEKLSYKCASLVKIGANHVELLLAAHTDISPWRKWVASPVSFRFLGKSLGTGQKLPYWEPTGETPWI